MTSDSSSLLSSSASSRSPSHHRRRLVQMPVPPVRPLLRRTIKRFLRLLPSALLLLFVVSLIFVTLMQIAVIHAHRRALAYNVPPVTTSGIGMASGLSTGNGNSSSISLLVSGVSSGNNVSLSTSSVLMMSPVTGAAAHRRPNASSSSNAVSSKASVLRNLPSKKKAEILRIEALLDRTSPSYETNLKMLQNFVNSARIKEIIKFAQTTRPALVVVRVGSGAGVTSSSSMASRGSKSGTNASQQQKSRTTVASAAHISQQQPPVSDSNEILTGLERIEEGTTENNGYFRENAGGDGGLADHGKSGNNPSLEDEPRNTRNLQAGSQSLPETKTLPPPPSSQQIVASSSANSKALSSTTTSFLIAAAASSSSSAAQMQPSNKSLCPAVPPKLVGRIRVETRPNKSMSDIGAENPSVTVGGRWRPTDCTSRHKVAIIVPYRDRMEHLATLLYHLHPILQRQLLDYQIYVVEQTGNDTFNKGVLMNAGVREALKEGNFHCFVFHDVDLIPEDDRNLYSCPYAPRHMSVAVDKFNYTLPYSYLVGGVFAISKAHYVVVNGYSNLYWGWGGEDDDMAHRLKFQNLHILRPPESIGRYTMIKHNHRAESPNNVRSALLRMAKRRASRDGLNSVRYQVSMKRIEPMFTMISVEIGHIHKWHFPSPNKLVLHF